MAAGRKFGLFLGLTLGLTLLFVLPVTAADTDCLACHGDPGMKSDKGKSLHVDPAKHKSSVHGELGCTTCHEGVKEYPHPKNMKMPTCASCHSDEVAQVPQSVHSILGKDELAPAATARHMKSSKPLNSFPSSAPPATTMRFTNINRVFTP